MQNVIHYIRSGIFAVIMIITTIIYPTISLLTFPFDIKKRYKFMIQYSRFIIFCAKVICGIKYHIEGLENLPKEPAIVFSNHQSTWETLAFQIFLPPQTWVVKKELLHVPFFGWALALLEPIAVERKKQGASIGQLLKQGKERLAEGRWIIVFPEGTRVAPGAFHKFARGGSILAEATQAPVVPIAHNAGVYWSRRAFLKKPGVVRMIIGKPIITKDKDATTINQEAESWIRAQLDKLLKV